MEPDLEKHYFFTDFDEAYFAWVGILESELIPDEIKQHISSPRQTHGGWIFDRETLWLS